MNDAMPKDRAMWTLGAIAMAIALLPVFFPSAYYYRIGALVFIFALAVLGLNLLMGYAGQVSLGHAGFFGIGGYAVAIGPTHLGIPSWAGIVGGAALSAAIAYVVGRPILRLKGHYLAIATLGLGLLIAIVLNNESGWTGGPDGMSVPRLFLLGFALRSSEIWYWVSGTTFLEHGCAHTRSTLPRPSRPCGKANSTARMTTKAAASLYFDDRYPALNASIIPSSSPPTTAPSALPIPPSMAAAKPFSASSVPTS